MGEPTMEIGERELQKIGEYVKTHLAEWMQAVRSPRELDLIERAVRLEEGQKNLHQQIALRSDNQQEYADKRFESHQEQMDRRFETMQQQMDQRFESQQKYMDKHFESLQQQMDRRFASQQEYIDTRFEAQQQHMDNRFAEQRQYMDSRFKSLQWFILIGFGLLSALIGITDLL